MWTDLCEVFRISIVWDRNEESASSMIHIIFQALDPKYRGFLSEVGRLIYIR